MKKGRKNVKAKRGKNVINSIAVVLIMLGFVGIMMYQIHNLRDENAELGAKEAAYQQTYDKELERTETLEEQKIYVQTKEYIEEAAKKLGFVYPDEIIFKPAEK